MNKEANILRLKIKLKQSKIQTLGLEIELNATIGHNCLDHKTRLNQIEIIKLRKELTELTK